MSHIAYTVPGHYAPAQRRDPIKWDALRLTVIDYAEMAFALMAVAFSPALVWLLVWMADR